MGAANLADLSAGAWGVATVAACAELGIVQRLAEPIGVAALADGAGVSPQVAQGLVDVLAALGVAERRGDRYVATPALAERSPAMLAADGTATVLAAADLVRRAAAGELGEGGWRHTDPAVLQAQGTMSAGAVVFLERFVFPRAVVPLALDRVRRALRPGGLLLLATLGGGGEDLGSAAARLRSVLWGGDALAPEPLVALLEAAGFEDITVLDRMASSLVPLNARRP